MTHETIIDYAAYQGAKPLLEALSAYSQAETLKAYDAANQSNQNGPKFASVLMAVGETASHVDKLSQTQAGLLMELKAQVTALVKKGDLLPVGFKIPRAETDKPILVPLDLFVLQNVNWDKSEVAGLDCAFSHVRLIEADPVNITANQFHRSGGLVPLPPKSTKTDFDRLGPSQQINEKEAAKYLGISVRQLQALRMKNNGPAFIKNGQAIRYKMADLTQWKK